MQTWLPGRIYRLLTSDQTVPPKPLICESVSVNCSLKLTKELVFELGAGGGGGCGEWSPTGGVLALNAQSLGWISSIIWVCEVCIWEAGGAEGHPQLHAKFEAHLRKTETTKTTAATPITREKL